MSEPRATRWRALCLLGTVVALALSAAVVRWGVLPGEAGLRVALRSGASPGVVELAQSVSDAGTWRGLVPATLMLLALSAYARRRWWLWSGLLVLTPLTGDAWQELVGRGRPHGSALGFPSGHAIAVATYAVLLCYLVGRAALARPWRVGIASVAIGAMVAVGLARIVRDSHWAADVVVGFALGSAGAAAAASWDLTHPPRVPVPAPGGPRAHAEGGSVMIRAKIRLRRLVPFLPLLLVIPTTRADAATARLRVVATTVQITALTKTIAGDAIDLKGLIPAGADPHEYEPRASDLVALEGAALILRHGIGLDEWLDRTLEAGRKATVVTVTTGIRVRKGEIDGKPVDDPHVWHDPANAKRMVDNIAAALGRVDPAHQGTYLANATAYKKRLDAAKAQVQAIITEIPPASRKLVTDHDALGYFARAFGLKIVGAVIPGVSTQAEPSAGDVAKLLERIRKEKVKAIFAESGANPKLAATLAKEAGVRIVDDLYGDSLGAPGSGAETVEGMWLANARKIADALK